MLLLPSLEIDEDPNTCLVYLTKPDEDLLPASGSFFGQEAEQVMAKHTYWLDSPFSCVVLYFWAKWLCSLEDGILHPLHLYVTLLLMDCLK